MSVERAVGYGVLLVSVLLVLVGCGGFSDRAPQPVIVRDTSPAQLDTFLVVAMGGYTPETRDATELHLGFAAGGRPVEFVGDERVVCNEVALQRFVGSFDATVPTATVAGKPLSCTYTAGHTSATLALTLPSAPAILSPMDQARVSREAGTIIRYSLPPGTLTAVVALAPTSKVAAGQGATGDTQTILNTRPLSAGPGNVTLNMDLTLPDMPNPGFKSFGVRGTAITSMQVTWI